MLKRAATYNVANPFISLYRSFAMRRITVRNSPVHGRGVFAMTNLNAGDLIIEYAESSFRGKKRSAA